MCLRSCCVQKHPLAGLGHHCLRTFDHNQRKEDFAIFTSDTGTNGRSPIGVNTIMLIWQNRLRSWSSATSRLPKTSRSQLRSHQPRGRSRLRRTSDQK